MPFRFKQFSVNDDKSTMKVGTDAVLLGAWADVGEAKSILDIGTGCGVIALMLAQRSGAHVTAIDIDKNSAEQAEENFKASPWSIEVFNTSLQDFEKGTYDLIVSNPPFFSNSFLPPKVERKNARHTETLTFDDLMKSVKRLLNPGGRFAVVIPADNAELMNAANLYGFYCNRKTSVYPRAKLERYLLEFSLTRKIPLEDELVLHDGDGRSAAYQKLAESFYLGTF